MASNGLYGNMNSNSIDSPRTDEFGRGGYGNAPADASHVGGLNVNTSTTGAEDYAQGGPSVSSPLSQSYMKSSSALESSNAGAMDGINAASAPMTTAGTGLNRSASSASVPGVRGSASRDATPSRAGTLKKKASVSRKTSLRRSDSRKSMAAGSIKGVGFGDDGVDFNSALHTPIPTQGTPTEILANRFQAWRSLLKSLIAYFREIQSSYDTRSKGLLKVSNVIQNFQQPTAFMTNGGLADATRILTDYHKHSLQETHKSQDIERDVIQALSGLRSDLSQKIKEIKSLSGDFKNSVEKEKDTTRKAIAALGDALGTHGDAKADPLIVRLSVDRAIERQIDEENYLHRAYLNLESSGRELESIVVGEIQKAYNAFAGILKREADDGYGAVESLRAGPVAMPKDMEWIHFVENDPHFVDPRLPLRRIEDITYPGKNDPAASEVRAGMLERKSKYLKSYTPGWYVLSPTHLHEFKSADKIYSQPPVMSLYLPDQKLGSHSSPDSSSHKFMLKGRQSGGMHRGHSWVFRAESYETMMAWFEAIHILTEKSGPEREAFVLKHTRSVSANSHRRSSVSSDGLEEDEADQVPYSAASSGIDQPAGELKPQRPVPGGRFPSDINVNRERGQTISDASSEPDHDTVVLGQDSPFPRLQGQPSDKYESDPYRLEGVATHLAAEDRDRGLNAPPVQQQYYTSPVDHFNAQPQQQIQQQIQQQQQQPQAQQQQQPVETQTFALPLRDEAPAHQIQPVRHNSSYGDWMAPAAVGAGAGVLGTAAYNKHKQSERDGQIPERNEDALQNPNTGYAVPIATTTNTLHHNTDQPMPPPPPAEVNAYPQQQQPEISNSGAALPTATMAAAGAGAFAANRGLSGEVPDHSHPATWSAHTPTGNADVVPAASYFDSTNAAPADPYAMNYSARLGGQEGHGAHETGHLFPAVVRHDTSISVSDLHVPGEFPHPSAAAGTAPQVATDGAFVPPTAWDKVRE